MTPDPSASVVASIPTVFLAGKERHQIQRRPNLVLTALFVAFGILGFTA